MKKYIILFTLLLTINCVFADTKVTTQYSNANSIPPTQTQNVSFQTCTKMFKINKNKLYYLTLGAVSANKFKIEEIQTELGYIIFSVGGYRYLATIAEIDAENSIIKITPCNNVYVFQPAIVLNMFKYIELNLNTEV